MSGLVLVPQLTRQLRGLGIGAVTQQRFEVGAKQIRVDRRGHERIVQVDVDLTEQRMEPVIHRIHRIVHVDIGPVFSVPNSRDDASSTDLNSHRLV